MLKLIDILTFRNFAEAKAPESERNDTQLRDEERDAAVLADKYPPDAADIETVSEYRLASLLQYPHY